MTKNYLKEKFEDILQQKKNFIDRGYSCMIVNEDDYNRVINNKGDYCELSTSGGGPYTQWYFYHSMDDKFVYIFRTYICTEDSYIWSWQFGKPRQEDISITSNFYDDENIDMMKAPKLERSCTLFNCICPEKGKQICEEYGIFPKKSVL